MKNEKAKTFSKDAPLDLLRGVAIGTAFIIPGFSGGSVAAILGIYEKLIGAIADIFKDFKRSVITLAPILIGMICGIIALLFPLKWALDEFPFPTVSLFVGLALGGLPSITENMRGKMKASNVLAALIPLILAASLSFLPLGAEVDLFSLDLGGYVLLFLIGIVGSAALVIPGISGSMLLLIFGYYNPIVGLVTNHVFRGEDLGISALVLATVGCGIIFGFILISYIMKLLLSRCRRGTYFAIFGFIIGSLPTVYISTAKDAGYVLSSLPPSPIHWVICVLMLAGGIALSLALVIFSKKRTRTTDTKKTAS